MRRKHESYTSSNLPPSFLALYPVRAGGFFSGLIHSGDKHRLTGPWKGGRAGLFHMSPSSSKVFPYCCYPAAPHCPSHPIARDQYRRRSECRGRLRLLVNCNPVRRERQCLPPSIKATPNTNTPTASCSAVWDLFAVVGAWGMHTRCFGFTEARHCYFSVHQIVCHEMFPFQNLKEKAKFISECILVRKLPQRPFFSLPCRVYTLGAYYKGGLSQLELKYDIPDMLMPLPS